MIVDRCLGCNNPLPPSLRKRKWCSERCRKGQYDRRCTGCGKRVDGSNPTRKSTGLCSTCLGVKRHDEARARVIARMRAWYSTHGEPPKAQDWNPVLARRRGREDQAVIAERGDWPHATVVCRLFSSWNKAVVASGFTPRAARPK